MSYSSRVWNPPPLDEQHVIDLCKVPDVRIWNIYLYGSQVYGTNKEDSDCDFLVLASSLNAHKEFYDGFYNVHVKTADLFKDELYSHKMLALECYFAPAFAKVRGKIDFDQFSIKTSKLQKRALSESHSSWIGGKRKILDGDIFRGQKSLWHSIRILMFAKQILDEGDIYDFSEANNHWEAIDDSEYVKWNDFKGMLLPFKRDLEDMVRG